MSVHKKLMEARIRLQNTKLTKSGHNKFAGYKYFELGDFLPAIQTIFADLGLCGVVSYATDVATLCIHDTETEKEMVITSPMSSAALKGCHEVQNLGAVQTYIRRYLWVTAMEIVEHDALDATTGSAEPEKPKKEKPVAAPRPTTNVVDGPWSITIPEGADWKDSIILAATKALDFAKTKEDVLEIFKVNRKIFDSLITEDKPTYDSLMAMFGEYKKKFNQ
jgi:hypothetical protein